MAGRGADRRWCSSFKSIVDHHMRLGEVCSHVAAVLFKIEAAVKLGLTQSSCTSEACQWNKTFREKLNPKSVVDCKHLLKHNRQIEVKTVVSSQHRQTLPDFDMLKDLKAVCPNAAFFSLIPKLDAKETDSATEEEDEMYLPEPLTSLYREEYSSWSQSDLKAECDQLHLRLTSITCDQIAQLEKVTRGQAVCPLWSEQRRGRITASIAHEVFTRKSTTAPGLLVKRIMGYDSRNLEKVPAIKWGLANESKARDAYVCTKSGAQHKNISCRLSGLVLDKDRPYIGASADGIVTCDCCQPWVLEIKCPYKHRDVSTLEAAKK
uniref:uncharacterized protein n=1 Tax=Myxine glutinosa TaxID=7769 RepID=UPI00358FC381